MQLLIDLSEAVVHGAECRRIKKDCVEGRSLYQTFTLLGVAEIDLSFCYRKQATEYEHVWKKPDMGGNE